MLSNNIVQIIKHKILFAVKIVNKTRKSEYYELIFQYLAYPVDAGMYDL